MDPKSKWKLFNSLSPTGKAAIKANAVNVNKLIERFDLMLEKFYQNISKKHE